MGKTKRMDQVKDIITCYLDCKSIKKTAARLHISKNTVRLYVRKAKEAYDDLCEVFSASDEQLTRVFYTDRSTGITDRQAIFDKKLDYWIKELKRVGVTRHLLWEEYRHHYPQGYGYSQFCERLKKEIGRRDLTLALGHKPAEYMQVDFAGKKMRWVDLSTGQVHDCEVLVCVLPFSHMSFVIALPSQKMEDFVYGLNQALLFFGGVPKVILSDNLKSYVKKTDRYDPTFTDLCIQLSNHYKLDLEATRVGKPKDKGSVENMVRTTYTRIYAPLRNEVFHSLEELNKAIRAQLIIHNNKSFQKKQGSRYSVFMSEEKPFLQSLPSDLFEVRKMTRAKVQRNYHVFLGQDKTFYSVPFKYVGKQTTIVYNSTLVEVYMSHNRIAVHQRLRYSKAYQHQTRTDHMPKSHQQWRQARGYNASWFLKQAEKVGPATKWAIGQVLLSRRHEPQSYNSCKGILRLGQTYSEQRLEKACLRCQHAGKATYSMLKNILARNLDGVDNQPDLFCPPDHDNIRGPQSYQ